MGLKSVILPSRCCGINHPPHHFILKQRVEKDKTILTCQFGCCSPLTVSNSLQNFTVVSRIFAVAGAGGYKWAGILRKAWLSWLDRDPVNDQWRSTLASKPPQPLALLLQSNILQLPSKISNNLILGLSFVFLIQRTLIGWYPDIWSAINLAKTLFSLHIIVIAQIRSFWFKIW